MLSGKGRGTLATSNTRPACARKAVLPGASLVRCAISMTGSPRPRRRSTRWRRGSAQDSGQPSPFRGTLFTRIPSQALRMSESWPIRSARNSSNPSSGTATRSTRVPSSSSIARTDLSAARIPCHAARSTALRDRAARIAMSGGKMLAASLRAASRSASTRSSPPVSPASQTMQSPRSAASCTARTPAIPVRPERTLGSACAVVPRPAAATVRSTRLSISLTCPRPSTDVAAIPLPQRLSRSPSTAELVPAPACPLRIRSRGRFNTLLESLEGRVDDDLLSLALEHPDHRHLHVDGELVRHACRPVAVVG